MYLSEYDDGLGIFGLKKLVKGVIGKKPSLEKLRAKEAKLIAKGKRKKLAKVQAKIAHRLAKKAAKEERRAVKQEAKAAASPVVAPAPITQATIPITASAQPTPLYTSYGGQVATSTEPTPLYTSYGGQVATSAEPSIDVGEPKPSSEVMKFALPAAIGLIALLAFSQKRK